MKLKITNNFALINAIVTNLLLCTMGIVFGIITNSSSILFDGTYSFLMLMFSISIFALIKHSKKSKNLEHYPYGMGKIENLLSFLKLILVLGLGVYFCIDSGLTLYTAVNHPAELPSVPDFEIYIIYISICSGISIYAYIIFKLANKNESSELIKAETKSTLIDFFITAAIGIALIAAALFVKGEVEYVTSVRTIIDKSILFLLIIGSTPSLCKLLMENIYTLLDKKSDHWIADRIFDFLGTDEIKEVSILANPHLTCVMIYTNKKYISKLTKTVAKKNEIYISELFKEKVYIEYILSNI